MRRVLYINLPFNAQRNTGNMEKNEKFIFSRIFCIIFKIRKIRRATNGLFKCELGNMIRKLLQVENHTISKQAVRQITMLD